MPNDTTPPESTPPDPTTRVIAYHDRTKHQPHRYARGPGGLDWASQPNPFRRFEGAPTLALPIPAESGDEATYDTLYKPSVAQPSPLSRASLSRFLYHALAISAWKEAGQTRWALRCNPSSGNLHPTEGYALLPKIDGLNDAPGLYHYTPREHGLEHRVLWDDRAWSLVSEGCPEGAFLVGLSSIHWREAWKYGERAFRYCQHDAGHALAGLRLSASLLGWRLVVLDELADRDVASVLGLDRVDDFQADEPEHPDMLAMVWPGDTTEWATGWTLTDEMRSAAASCKTIGKANRLSERHAASWEVIDEVADACEKPATPARPLPNCSDDEANARSRISARQVIRQRRSAVSFDGKTALSAETFYQMMRRVMPGRSSPPWDAVSWPARVHLGLFVHRVAGLTSGLYVLAREPAKVDVLRAAMDSDFVWRSPSGCPADLPLYCLMEADARNAAIQLSLGQEIAGMSAFSLGMLAEFDGPLRDEGAWLYRRLFWEAGMVGQVLYLEAEAAGVRATGIGAYFDDPVHEVFGLGDRTFQSMYHFTVGGPVDDTRLTTLPAYPPQDNASG